MVSEITSDEKGEVSVFQPAEDLSRLSVGMLIDRFETKGKWEISLKMENSSHKKWNAAIANHSAYLNEQRKILLKDM